MAKAAKPKVTAKPKPKPNKKGQYERFLEIAREFGVDDERSAEMFERDFGKIVPPKSRSAAGR
jgi:hypothetical protein